MKFLIILLACSLFTSVSLISQTGNWFLIDTSGQNIVEHLGSHSSIIKLRLMLNGQSIQKMLNKGKGAFSEDSKVSVVLGANITQTFSGASVGVDTYADEEGTAVMTVGDGQLDGLVVNDGFAWRIHARLPGHLQVENDGNVEGLCAGDDAKDARDRRLAVQRWTNCYTGDSMTHRLSIGVVIGSGLFERRFGNSQAQATEWLNSVVADANLIYKHQLNIVLSVGELIIQQGSHGAPSWDDPSCQLGLREQLNRFQAWEQPSKQGLWHLLDDCWGSSGSAIGLATMLVSDTPGTLCMMERVRGHNEFWNTAVSWYSSRTWKTFAHEVGHNFGGHHSFEEGQGSTGGIMDYGDGKLNGEYQFNTKYRKGQICRSINKVVGTCSAFSLDDGIGATTTVRNPAQPGVTTTSTTQQHPGATTTTLVPCNDNCRDRLVPDGRMRLTFNGVVYTDCVTLIADTNQFGSGLWCSRFEPSAQVCQLSCGACTLDCTTAVASTITSTSSSTSSTTSTSPSSSTSTSTGMSMSITSTITTTTTTIPTKRSIVSGDSVFLKTLAGSGAHIDVDGIAVQARWESRGNWQAFVIEKATGGRISSGDIIFLRTQANKYLDIETDTVQARWDDQGIWQSVIIERKSGVGAILPDDLVCFKSLHTGKHIDFQDGAVRARWEDCGDWQTMLIEKEVAGAVFSGSTVAFAAHTGRHIDVQGQVVQARWTDRGLWQSFVIENFGGRALFAGDEVFLKSVHTGKMLDVHGVSVQARWHDYGALQRFSLEKEGGGPIMPGDSIFLRAHTGKFLEVQGVAVGANWDDRGSWQTLLIEVSGARRLSQEQGELLVV